MRLILFTALYLMLTFCFAQNTSPKNELGININGNEMILGHGNYHDFKHFPFYGLQYKRSLTHGYWFRSSFQYYSETNTFNDESNNIFWVKGKEELKLFDSRFGIEKLIYSSKKIIPFVLFDLNYRYENRKGDVSGYGDFSPYYYSSNYNNSYHNIGLFTGFGFKYYPIKRLYISAETSIGLITPLFEGNLNTRLNLNFNPIKTIAIGIRF